MRKLLVIPSLIALFLIPLPTLAKDLEEQKRKTQESAYHFCDRLSVLGELAMSHRQVYNTPITMLIDAIVGDSKITRELIYEAYRQPRWSSSKRQNEAVIEFKNKVYLECVTSLPEELER